MKSPFPGMDPYLEQHWGDVHQALIYLLKATLNDSLPEGLVARAEERVFLESGEGAGRGMVPDVRVVERSPSTLAPAPAGGVAVAEPLNIHCPAPEPLTESFLEIIDPSSGNRVVTVVEVLSKTNKIPGEGQRLYLQKQREVVHSDANLVEIDLLRAGQRILVVPLERLANAPQSPYAICVHRGVRPEIREWYPITLREQLPRFRIPLRSTDADVVIDLQPLLDQCYRSGRYGATNNYKGDPDPPLSADDAIWADELLRKARLRG